MLIDDRATEVSLHPPHLVDSQGSLTPAALIPFCAYQTNMTLLGQTRQHLPFTVCDKFKPAVLEGQLCYSLDLKSIDNADFSNFGLEHGLLLVLDPGISEKNRHQKETTQGPTEKISSLNLKAPGDDKSSAKIYVNTLARHTDYRAGSYAMTSLKRMTGTSSFLKLSDVDKKCQVETFEECTSQRYTEEVQRQCGCIPWALSSALKLEVSP